ncbi:MAG: ABC transporter ATP-binding protein [Lautropia sp.]
MAASVPAGLPAADAARAPAHLRVEGIGKRYGGQQVVRQLDFSVARGELVSLLGPSGCGKTTLLRLIAGLVPADEGRIVLGERDLSRVPAHRRNVSVVFQSYALFPHLNVHDNVAFGLRARGISGAAAGAAVDEALALVRMSEYARRPVTLLSGGQQQRVAVARALVVDPDLLLLDEPFSALDRKLRETMQIELRALLRSRGMTAVFVTHDQDEALTVSDRIAVMNAGRIEHFADPATLYSRPATAFALDFVGLSTRLAGSVRAVADGIATIDTVEGPITARANFTPGSRVLVGIRPECIRIVPSGGGGVPGTNRIVVEVSDVVRLGARTHVYGRAQEGDRLLCERSGNGARVPEGAALADATNTPRAGERVAWAWPVEDTLVYPASH